MSRAFDRPDLDQKVGGLVLYITGQLPNAEPSVAYSGRLQFHNAIGGATAELWDGTLPPGSTVSVDMATSEIVVAWPAYQEAAAPIENPGLEGGGAGWEFGAGWSVTTDNPISGARSAVFQNVRGESMASSLSRYPVTPGQSVNASCAVRQGASSSGNAGAAVCLEFRDSTGAIVRSVEGNRVMSASSNSVKPSNVSATSQGGEATLNIAARGIRKRQNRDVWVDTFAWNHTVPAVGIEVEGTIGPITIRLTDSLGRTAFWTGSLLVSSGVKWIIAFSDSNENGSGFIVSQDGATWGDPLITMASYGLSGPFNFGEGKRFNGATVFMGSASTSEGGNPGHGWLYTTDEAATVTVGNAGFSAGGGSNQPITTGGGYIFRANGSVTTPGLWRAASASGPWTFFPQPSFEAADMLAFRGQTGRLVTAWTSRDYVLTSDDNAGSFTKQATPVFGTNIELKCIAANETRFFAGAGDGGSDPSGIKWSPTAASGSWTSSSISFGVGQYPEQIVCGEGGDVVVYANDGAIFYSVDNGQTFTLSAHSVGGTPIASQFNAGRHVVVAFVGGNPKVMTTRNIAGAWSTPSLHATTNGITPGAVAALTD